MTDPSHVGPIQGSYWVVPGRLLAGPYPCTDDQLAALVGAGVNCFIDLTQAGELDPYAPHLPDGVQHQRLPIRDFSTPTRDHMALILDTIESALAAGQTVYVHCWGGVGRTGTVIGCYLVRGGKSGDEALREVERLRRERSPETAEQRAMVLRWKG